MDGIEFPMEHKTALGPPALSSSGHSNAAHALEHQPVTGSTVGLADGGMTITLQVMRLVQQWLLNQSC
jgi:hypothetical protein